MIANRHDWIATWKEGNKPLAGESATKYLDRANRAYETEKSRTFSLTAEDLKIDDTRIPLVEIMPAGDTGPIPEVAVESAEPVMVEGFGALHPQTLSPDDSVMLGGTFTDEDAARLKREFWGNLIPIQLSADDAERLRAECQDQGKRFFGRLKGPALDDRKFALRALLDEFQVGVTIASLTAEHLPTFATKFAALIERMNRPAAKVVPLRRTVVLESPYSAKTAEGIEENVQYARRCLADALGRGEAAFASHLLFTQVGVLDDSNAGERARGRVAGFRIGEMMSAAVVYMDRGISPGMAEGIRYYATRGIPIEYRLLDEPCPSVR